MDYYITQNINIRTLRVDGITNSSVLQIGSSGCIRTTAHLYDTGGFVSPAPQLQQPETGPAVSGTPLVPLGAAAG